MNDFVSVIDKLHNAGFDDFDTMLIALRKWIGETSKVFGEKIFKEIDHDRNNKIDNKDIYKLWRDLKYALNHIFRPEDIAAINDSWVATQAHYFFLTGLKYICQYLGLVN